MDVRAHITLRDKWRLRAVNRRQFVAGMSLAAFISSCSKNLGFYRYSLGLEIETPEGLTRGSTIIEVRTASQLEISGAISRSALGDAAVVDLGKRRLLFALLSADKFLDWASNVYLYLTPTAPDGRSAAESAKQTIDAIRASRGIIEIPRHSLPYDRDHVIPSYPTLVTFRNPNDYHSIMWVDPDNLEDTFGKGFFLKKMTVSITDDNLQRNLQIFLPWVDSYVEYYDSIGADAPYWDSSKSDIRNLIFRK